MVPLIGCVEYNDIRLKGRLNTRLKVSYVKFEVFIFFQQKFDPQMKMLVDVEHYSLAFRGKKSVKAIHQEQYLKE